MSRDVKERLKLVYEQIGRKFYKEFGSVELEDLEYRKLFEQVKKINSEMKQNQNEI